MGKYVIKEETKLSRIMKSLTGIGFMIPWLVYQLTPLAEHVNMSWVEAVLTTLMIVGLIVTATVRRERESLLPKL